LILQKYKETFQHCKYHKRLWDSRYNVIWRFCLCSRHSVGLCLS